MCDNNNINANNLPNKCVPCINDPIGCSYTNVDHVIANNLNVKKIFKNLKCQVLAFVNSLSVEFLQNADANEVELERSRLNTLIESLITGIHQTVKTRTTNLEPNFQLWIQKETGSAQAAYCSDNNGGTESGLTDENMCETLGTCVDGDGNSTTTSQADCANDNTWTAFTWVPYEPAPTQYSIGAGWIDMSVMSGCYDSNGNATTDTYDTCETNGNTWNGSATDLQYSAGTLANLHPKKISLTVDCNEGGITPSEIVYLYIPSLQLLYNPLDSSLLIRWGDVNVGNNPLIKPTCSLPVITYDELLKTRVFNLVPPSYDAIGDNDDSEVWDSQANLYRFIKNDLLLQNNDLHLFINYIDQVVRQCELANTSLLLKRRIDKING